MSRDTSGPVFFVFFYGLKPTVPEDMATVLDEDLKSFYPIDSHLCCPQVLDPGWLISCRQPIAMKTDQCFRKGEMSPLMLLQAEQMHIKTKQQCIRCTLQWGGWCTSSSLAALRGQFLCAFLACKFRNGSSSGAIRFRLSGRDNLRQSLERLLAHWRMWCDMD